MRGGFERGSIPTARALCRRRPRPSREFASGPASGANPDENSKPRRSHETRASYKWGDVRNSNGEIVGTRTIIDRPANSKSGTRVSRLSRWAARHRNTDVTIPPPKPRYSPRRVGAVSRGGDAPWPLGSVRE